MTTGLDQLAALMAEMAQCLEDDRCEQKRLQEERQQREKYRREQERRREQCQQQDEEWSELLPIEMDSSVKQLLLDS